MFSNINVIILVILSITACSSATSNFQQHISPSISKSGVQLWADNCARCHSLRPPESYSDAQWGVATLHMRVRANLTATDANAIVKYLKSAN